MVISGTAMLKVYSCMSWVGYVIAGSLIPLTVDQQINSDTLETKVILNAGVISLVEGLAIDEAGIIWT
jgi:hypothetical protein